MTLILALDTATPAVTAGVVRRDGAACTVLAQQVTVDARAHAERLAERHLVVRLERVTDSDVRIATWQWSPS